MTAKVIQERNDENLEKEKEGEIVNHPYKWNHSKYKCECNGNPLNHQNDCCRSIKVKQELDTNLGE